MTTEEEIKRLELAIAGSNSWVNELKCADDIDELGTITSAAVAYLSSLKQKQKGTKEGESCGPASAGESLSSVSSLLPCPFCGVQPRFVSSENSRVKVPKIECRNCHLVMWGMHEGFERKSDAFRRWNTRVSMKDESAPVAGTAEKIVDQMLRPTPCMVVTPHLSAEDRKLITTNEFREQESAPAAGDAFEVWWNQAWAGLQDLAEYSIARLAWQAAIEPYEEVLKDQRRLVRELDVAINGKNAAKQASLCDIVCEVKRRAQSAKPVGAYKRDERIQNLFDHMAELGRMPGWVPALGSDLIIAALPAIEALEAQVSAALEREKEVRKKLHRAQLSCTRGYENLAYADIDEALSLLGEAATAKEGKSEGESAGAASSSSMEKPQ